MATLPIQAPSPVGGALSAPQTAPAPGLVDRWRAWVQQPQNRTALLQTGLALMQPLSLGQSPIGHIADAIGQGGEARDRYITGGQEQAKEAETRMMDQKKFGLEERQVAAQEKNIASQVTERAKGGKSLRDFYAKEAFRDENSLTANLRSMAAAEAKAHNDNAVINNPDAPMLYAADFMNDPLWVAKNIEAARRLEAATKGVYSGGTGAPAGTETPPMPGAFMENGQWKVMQNGKKMILQKNP